MFTRGKERAGKWEQLTEGKVFFFPRFYYSLNSNRKLIMETTAPQIRKGKPWRIVMTSGLQLLLIFQFPHLSNPLENLISSAHDGGFASSRRMDMDVATGLRIPLSDGWAFLISTWRIAQTFENALHSNSLASLYDLATSGKAILTLQGIPWVLDLPHFKMDDSIA